jgi:hypothetical protein
VFEPDNNTAHFQLEAWHPLTEARPPTPVSAPAKVPRDDLPRDQTVAPGSSNLTHPHVLGASPALIRILFDILVYLYSSVSVRIKRLGISARAFEQAKVEGCEKKLIFESAAGGTTYLIPFPETFVAFGFPCSYEDVAHIEHSFYVGLNEFLLKKDPANRSVSTESKRGTSGCTGDIVTVRHDGTRRAYEVTLSTGNVLSNATKYVNTDFVQIVFLCRDYRLREAVKACCHEGGLDPELLAKLEFIQFSTLLTQQRKLSLY